MIVTLLICSAKEISCLYRRVLFSTAHRRPPGRLSERCGGAPGNEPPARPPGPPPVPARPGTSAAGRILHSPPIGFDATALRDRRSIPPLSRSPLGPPHPPTPPDSPAKGDRG